MFEISRECIDSVLMDYHRTVGELRGENHRLEDEVRRLKMELANLTVKTGGLTSGRTCSVDEEVWAYVVDTYAWGDTDAYVLSSEVVERYEQWRGDRNVMSSIGFVRMLHNLLPVEGGRKFVNDKQVRCIKGLRLK